MFGIHLCALGMLQRSFTLGEIHGCGATFSLTMCKPSKKHIQKELPFSQVKTPAMPAVNRNVLGQALDDAQDVWLVLPEHFARTQAAQRRQEVLERRAREQVRGMQRPHLLQMISSTCISTTNYLKLL